MQYQPVDEEQRQRNLQDPEIIALMNDSTITQALKELSENPKASQVLQDPKVSDGLQTLIAAGIVRLKCLVCLQTCLFTRFVVALYELDEGSFIWNCGIRNCDRCGYRHREMRRGDRRYYRIGSHNDCTNILCTAN